MRVKNTMKSMKCSAKNIPWAKLLVLALILSLLGLGLGSSSGFSFSQLGQRDPQLSLDRAISSVEDALDSIEEIETAADLEEAQELASDAEQDLKDAIDELEDIEIPNWLYLPEQGALYWHGPILDKQTEQPIEAEVFVNGHVIANQATEVQFLMWATEDEPVWVRVEAQGYRRWELRFRFHLEGLKVMEGPVWLERK